MNFKQLQQELATCRDCQKLFGFEPTPILFGNQQAAIMQIGQAPSRTVSETGLPFSDASGKRLKQQWYQIPDEVFYNPNYFYIASMAHCYPGKNLTGRGDRKPPAHCAKKWLAQEIRFVDNQIYLVIGSYAAKFLFPEQTFQESVFQSQTFLGKPAFVLPHPSPLNSKWLRDHPAFTAECLPKIRAELQKILKKDSDNKKK